MYRDFVPKSLWQAVEKRIKGLENTPPPTTMEEKLAACQKECDKYNKAYFGEERALFNCPVCLDKGRILFPEYETMYKDYITVMYRCRCKAGDKYPAFRYLRAAEEEDVEPPEEFVNESLFGV